MVMVVVKIDEQGRLIIPKEIRERKKMTNEVILEETKDGIIIKPQSVLTWTQFFKTKLKLDWTKVRKLDLSEENFDDMWL